MLASGAGTMGDGGHRGDIMRHPALLRTLAIWLAAAFVVMGGRAAAEGEAYFTRLDAGAQHICGIDLEGAVLCWGANDYGQLGRNDARDRAYPMRVRRLTGPATAVTAGEAHSCAVSATGARCWGRNAEGQLGTGDFAYRLVATATRGMRHGAAGLTAGTDHSCALAERGGLRCWGGNTAGQLGDGTLITSPLPVTVQDLPRRLAQVGAGWRFTCGRDRRGGVQCWGDGRQGRLGDGTGQDSPRPVTVQGLARGTLDLSVGIGHSCVVTGAGAVRCWGSNDFGQLGDGSGGPGAFAPVPVTVAGLPDVAVGVAAGGGHSCAILGAARSVWCWGWNIHGQLGNDSDVDSAVPVAVQGLPGPAVTLTLGDLYGCALMEDGRAFCWGSDDRGQLGRGGTIPSPVARSVLLPPG